MSDAAGPDANPHPFTDLDDYLAIPRVAGLTVSPDGSRLVTSVSDLDADGKAFVSALWELDPAGGSPARRLTRSAPGESAPTFAPDGSLLFVSKRADPDAGSTAPDPKPALWSLPAGGGEARLVAGRVAGLSGYAVARDTGDVVVLSSVGVVADGLEADDELRTGRKDAGVTGILHESYPSRFWDHDLGQSSPHALWVGPVDEDTAVKPDGWRDLTPQPPIPHGVGESVQLSPDGSLMAYAQAELESGAGVRRRLVVVDTASGDERVLLDDPASNVGSPIFSPDSSSIVCIRQQRSSFAEPPDQTLVIVEVASGSVTELTPGFDRWPVAPQFDAAGDAVFFTADDDGHHAVFRVEPGSPPVRLTASGAYTDVTVAPDGSAIYAMRSAIDSPPRPVRLDPHAPDQAPDTIPCPGDVGPMPGRLTRFDTAAADGSSVQSWLVLPDGASADDPAPLVLWIHGGPLMSFNGWAWRWCPWLLASQGYAVLMPNPGLSQGFGQDFVRRGWGAWGAEPYTDLMAAVDDAIARPDIDETRTSAMGGSFGGYMANWVATQTDRFDAIITHASLWHLDGFVGATDLSSYWEQEFGDPLAEPARYEANSPHRFADSITTPMLVIHGDKDYRVPIGEGLRLWYDLQKRGVESKYLYFPDENHWILKPGNSKVWYETVRAFLAQHMLGEGWQRPELL